MQCVLVCGSLVEVEVYGNWVCLNVFFFKLADDWVYTFWMNTFFQRSP